MDITRIKQALAARVAEVSRYLLPGGRREGQEWRVGSLAGDVGQSLGIRLHGPKAGVWCDFNTGDTGDVVDLWMQVRRVGLSQALKEAAEWLGVSRQDAVFKPHKTYARPARPKCSAPRGRVRDYLVEARNIPERVLDAYKVGEQGDMIVFPFLLPGGDLAMVKLRKAEDGGKTKPSAANCEPVLFGWQAIDPDSRYVLLTEGEIDALSWSAYGYPAMSIPFGGGGGAKQQWIENEFERMERFERIYIATDMDKPGEEAAMEIASRLGRHRCYRVSMPFKDGNACLMEGVSMAVMDMAVAEAKSLDPEGLRRPSEFTDAVVGLFWPADGVHVGYRTPYGQLGEKLLFRPGEVTLWTGASGSGKSQLLSDCTIEWIKCGSRVCISSLEMRAVSMLKRMCKQTSGVDRPTEPFIGASLQWLSQGLLLYDVTGKASAETLIEVFDYARAKYGCDQFIIDSLMRLGISSDDYAGQEKAMFGMVNWAVSSNIHLHIVAHARKGGPQSGAPETEDVKGGMEIGANAFNIVGVWRNRQLEDEIRKMEAQGQADELRKTPGVILNVAKQRNGDFEGKVGLWFDQSNYRYYSSHERSSWNRQYLNLAEIGNERLH